MSCNHVKKDDHRQNNNTHILHVTITQANKYKHIAWRRTRMCTPTLPFCKLKLCQTIFWTSNSACPEQRALNPPWQSGRGVGVERDRTGRTGRAGVRVAFRSFQLWSIFCAARVRSFSAALHTWGRAAAVAVGLRARFPSSSEFFGAFSATQFLMQRFALVCVYIHIYIYI